MATHAPPGDDMPGWLGVNPPSTLSQNEVLFGVVGVLEQLVTAASQTGSEPTLPSPSTSALNAAAAAVVAVAAATVCCSDDGTGCPAVGTATSPSCGGSVACSLADANTTNEVHFGESLVMCQLNEQCAHHAHAIDAHGLPGNATILGMAPPLQSLSAEQSAHLSTAVSNVLASVNMLNTIASDTDGTPCVSYTSALPSSLCNDSCVCDMATAAAANYICNSDDDDGSGVVVRDVDGFGRCLVATRSFVPGEVRMRSFLSRFSSLLDIRFCF